MWPSGTEPLADQSFSTTPTQLLGMKRSVSQASRMNAAATENTVISRRELNIRVPPSGAARSRFKPLAGTKLGPGIRMEGELANHREQVCSRLLRVATQNCGPSFVRAADSRCPFNLG